MSKTLKLLWQFKWITVATLFIELLILLPAYLMLYRFGERTLAINLAVTPVGSTEHFGVLIDAISNHSGLVYGLFIFVLILPLLFLTKLALAAGTIASVQQEKWRISNWLSEAGRNALPTLGLFLRWLIIPIILCGLVAVLMKFSDGAVKTAMLGLLAVAWLFSLSWFSYALNFTVLKEKKALIKGFSVLRKNLKRFLITTVIFVAGAAAIKLTSWFYFKSNGMAETGLTMAIVGAVVLGLATRFLILFWQTSHVAGWRKVTI